MLPDTLSELAIWIEQQERAVPDLKQGNAARIHWASHRVERTPLAVVYLHGFSASPGECGDLPVRLANTLGANAFIARLPGHGRLAADALAGVDMQQWLDAARQAYAIGTRLADRVVLAGTSLGASLALWLAAHQPQRVAAVLAWTLAARAFDEAAFERLCQSRGVIVDPRARIPAHQRYWSDTIHTDGYRALRSFLHTHMTPTTARCVRAPLFLAYHYRDALQQDRLASVAAMLELFAALGTSPDLRLARSYGEGAHAIASPWRSPAAEQVMLDSVAFLRGVT